MNRSTTKSSSKIGFGIGLSLCAGVVLSAGACSSKDSSFTQDQPVVLTPDDAAAPKPRCAEVYCSRDLKKVLGKQCEDAPGEVVVEECSADQGCGGGTCVSACQSAELSKGSTGCSFWTLPPEDASIGLGSCFATMISNTWDRPVTLNAFYGNDALPLADAIYTASLDASGTTIYTKLAGPLPAGEVAIVFLSQAPAEGKDPAVFTTCPDGVKPALNQDPLTHATGITKAFQITADAPVSAYSIFPYGGASSYFPSSTLLYPVSSWGTNYVAVNVGKVIKTGGQAVKPPNPKGTLQLVANDDDTHVRIRPTVDIVEGGGAAGALAGQVQTWTLSKGQVLQLSQLQDLTGSPIESDKPIGMFGGSECAFVPTSYSACDLLRQQVAPVAQWGSEYALVPFEPRVVSSTGNPSRELVPWRIVGAVDGTKLTYDPAPPAGAPEYLAAGQVVNFMSEQLVVVKSQDAAHPFYAGVYMTGASFNGTINVTGGVQMIGDTLGDPDFVNVVPSDQFLDHYVFFADYTYPDTNITVVRRKTDAGFAPVNLACAGEIQGWEPLGSSGEYEFAWVELTRGGVPQTFGASTCSYGRHEIQSDGPFSVTVWGLAKYASYGYTGGQGSRPINQVTVPVIK